jgi:uncharacterized glyoxalase superfamily protein PhnB
MGNPSTECIQHPLAVMLTCRDTKRQVAFYRDTLGFTLKESWPDDSNPMWANLVLDGQSVMVGGACPPDKVEAMCGDAGPDEIARFKALAGDYEKHKAGVGLQVYVMVPDIDAYHAQLVKRGLKGLRAPKTQFYGLKDVPVTDPEGYQIVFYTPVAMSTCQSCGMPLTDAVPGQMYCPYCTDDKGKLRPYEVVLEGTTVGYFMQMQKLPRDKAEVAAKAHLKTMPAWATRG